MKIEKGLVFTGKWFTGRVEVIEVIEDENVLHVELKKDNSTWREDWNLAHTRIGFKNGDYFLGEYEVKKTYTRPVVVNQYTQGEWKINEVEVIQCPSHFKIIDKDLNEIARTNNEFNVRLIANAPKLHQFAEAFFDMIASDGTSMYLPMLEKVLNDINPKEK